MDIHSRSSAKPRVEVLCGERTYLLSEMFFCDQCSSLCPPHEVLQTHDIVMCPSCSHTPNAVEAASYLNRCSRCFECPVCAIVLSFTSGLDPNSDKPYYFLFCGNCYWDSKSKLGLTRPDPKDIVHELISIERVLPTPEDFTPLKSYYKKLDADSTRQELLKSALKKRYEKYSLMNSPHLARKATDPYRDGVYPMNDQLIRRHKEDIWANDYPEALKSILLPSYIELDKILCKQDKADSSPQHQQTSPRNDLFSRDLSILDSLELNQAYDEKPTLRQRLNPNFYDIDNLHNKDRFVAGNTQGGDSQDISSTIGNPSGQPNTPISGLPQSQATTNVLQLPNTIPPPGKSLPARVPLISRPSKRCKACNTMLLVYNKPISTSKSSNFYIDHRALNWIPMITVKGVDLIESTECMIYLMVKNPLEKPIEIDLDFNDNEAYTLGVVSKSFSVPIDPFDSIQALMDSEDEEGVCEGEDLPEFVAKSKGNMKLLRFTVLPKADTVGKSAQFVCKLSVKFEDLVGKKRNIQMTLLITIGNINKQHLQTIESI